VSDPSIRLGYYDIRILIGARTNLTAYSQVFPEYDYPNHPEYYSDMLWTVVVKDNKGGVTTTGGNGDLHAGLHVRVPLA
jgi:hypothetical protein